MDSLLPAHLFVISLASRATLGTFLIFSHRQGRHPCGVGVPVSLGQVLSASGGLDQLIMQNWSVDNSQRPNKRPVS